VRPAGRTNKKKSGNIYRSFLMEEENNNWIRNEKTSLMVIKANTVPTAETLKKIIPIYCS